MLGPKLRFLGLVLACASAMDAGEKAPYRFIGDSKMWFSEPARRSEYLVEFTKPGMVEMVYLVDLPLEEVAEAARAELPGHWDVHSDYLSLTFHPGIWTHVVDGTVIMICSLRPFAEAHSGLKHYPPVPQETTGFVVITRMPTERDTVRTWLYRLKCKDRKRPPIGEVRSSMNKRKELGP